MSAAQPAPIRQHSSRQQSRAARRRAATESEAGPLAGLHRRCAGGSIVAWSVYLAVVGSTVAYPDGLSLKQIIGLEFGLGILATLCTLVAIVVWILTRCPAYAMSLWDMANNAKNAGAAPSSNVPTVVPPARLHIEGLSAIPIEHGHQVRQQRAHRAG